MITALVPLQAPPPLTQVARHMYKEQVIKSSALLDTLALHLAALITQYAPLARIPPPARSPVPSAPLEDLALHPVQLPSPRVRNAPLELILTRLVLHLVSTALPARRRHRLG